LSRGTLPEAVIGEIVAIVDDGCTPLVLFPGQPGTAALRARSVLDLHGAHIGQQAVLSFEGGDASRPIVMGVLRQPGDRPLDAPPGQVQVEADGQRMVVNARQELVLQCGKASITLTKAGKVLIQGTYVSSRSSGVNRVKGGSVQLN
jgi:phage baseplate assembly protein gpV